MAARRHPPLSCHSGRQHHLRRPPVGLVFLFISCAIGQHPPDNSSGSLLAADHWLEQARWLRMGGNVDSAKRAEATAARLSTAAVAATRTSGTSSTLTIVLVWSARDHVAILEMVSLVQLRCRVDGKRVGFLLFADAAGLCPALADTRVKRVLVTRCAHFSPESLAGRGEFVEGSHGGAAGRQGRQLGDGGTSREHTASFAGSARGSSPPVVSALARFSHNTTLPAHASGARAASVRQRSASCCWIQCQRRRRRARNAAQGHGPRDPRQRVSDRLSAAGPAGELHRGARGGERASRGRSSSPSSAQGFPPRLWSGMAAKSVCAVRSCAAVDAAPL